MDSLEIIQDVSKNLSISRGIGENSNDWHSRIIYSALGKIALASLWDSDVVDAEAVSIQHFKNRIKSILADFVSLSQASADYLQDEQALADEIYQIYLSTGFVYHTSFHLSPPVNSSAQGENIILLRGGSPLQLNAISGLGEYKLVPEQSQQGYCSILDMFSLHQPFCDLMTQYEKSAIWESADVPEKAEFLELSDFRHGYWQKIPDKACGFSLARVPLQIGHIYYSYRYHDNSWQWTQLPEWRSRITICGIEKSEWLALATGVLMRNHQMPDIHVVSRGDFLTVSCPYLLPPAEESFFKLYSWPMPHDGLNSFGSHVNRQMSANVYPMFKATMSSLGYQFKEEL